MAYILGIESSCDETSAAVVRDGEELMSNVVLSQIVTHRAYGGVVPELASREHLRAIVPVVREATEKAGIELGKVDGLAVTKGPGLAGALLVGVSYAKALAFALDKPLIPVLYAVVTQLGRKKSVVRQQIGIASQGDNPDSDCAPPTWEKNPVRVTFHPKQGQQLSFSIRGHSADVAPGSEEEN